EGTGQTRMRLWSDWMDKFRGSPVFGEGLPVPKEEDVGKTAAELGHLAHNSYLQAFADWGFLGGMLFVGAFYLALWGVGRLKPRPHLAMEPHMARLQPFLLGALAAYAASLFSLSMTDRVPTFFMLALGG